jgi:hypothetical protein
MRSYRCTLLFAAAAGSAAAAGTVYEHCVTNGNITFKEPSGELPFKYLVPGGFYDQLWYAPSPCKLLRTTSFLPLTLPPRVCSLTRR